MIRKTLAEINLNNLCHNYNELRKLQNHSDFFCPMLKSSAYGHGDVEVAKALSKVGCQHFGVALVEEAVTLRESEFKNQNILVFGPFGQEAVSYISEFNITPVVSVMDQLLALIDSQKKIKVHVKLNTGMNRLGFDQRDWSKVSQLLKDHPQIEVEGVCSHLASAEDFFEDDSFTKKQISNFEKGIKELGIPVRYIHLFNSLGLIANTLGPQYHWGARPGISLYGVKPHLHNLKKEQQVQWDSLNLKPVMTLKSEVIAYHKLKKGEKVSYGGRWVAPRNSLIGVIPIGYADGYHRLFSQQGIILYREKRVPVVGTVCMDYIMVDLTDILNDTPGEWREEAILFGMQNSIHLAVEEIAKMASTISYELLTGVSKRVPRIYVE